MGIDRDFDRLRDPITQWGIAYTEDGSPPGPRLGGKIVRWKQDSGMIMIWENRNEALEMCGLDGWRGYVCTYPDGSRPTV